MLRTIDDEIEDGLPPTEFWCTTSLFSDEGSLVKKFQEEMSTLPPMEEMSSRFLTKVVYTLGIYQRKHYRRDFGSPVIGFWKEIEKEWLAATLKKLPEFSPKNLSNTLYAFATLGIVPPKEFQDAFFSSAGSKLDDFNSRDLANLFYSCSRLGLVPPDDPPQRFQTHLLKALANKIPEFDVRELSTILYPMADLGLYPPMEFWEAYFLAAADKILLFEPKDLANNLLTFPKLGIAPSDKAPHRFLSHTLQAVEDKLPGFNSRDISTALGALFKLGIVPSKAFRNTLFSVVTDKLKDFDTRELSTTLHSLARLGLAPTDEFLKNFVEAGTRKLESFSPQSVANCLWALAVISVLRALPEETLAFASELAEKAKTADLKDIEKHQCGLACLRLFPENENPFSLKSMREETSKAEMSFLTHLAASGFRPDEKLGFIPSLETKVDYAFYMDGVAKKNVPVLIEYDGPFLFFKNHPSGLPRYEGSTFLMTALTLQECLKINPKTIFARIGEHEASLLKATKRKHLLEKMKAELPELKPGVAYKIKLIDEKVIYAPIPCVSARQSTRPSGIGANKKREYKPS